MKKIILIVLFLIFQSSNTLAEKIKINVWNSYLTPPFYDEESGLAADFVQLLNELATTYEFELRSIPRARLNFYLSKQHKVNYKDPESIIGLKFGAVRGRDFKPLNPYFISKAIKRIDVNREEQILKLLIKGRIDVTSLPRTSINYLCQSLGLKGKLYFSPQYLYSFSRHIIVTPSLEKVHLALLKVVSKLNENLRWQSILKK